MAPLFCRNAAKCRTYPHKCRNVTVICRYLSQLPLNFAISPTTKCRNRHFMSHSFPPPLNVATLSLYVAKSPSAKYRNASGICRRCSFPPALNVATLPLFVCEIRKTREITGENTTHFKCHVYLPKFVVLSLFRLEILFKNVKTKKYDKFCRVVVILHFRGKKVKPRHGVNQPP